MVTTSDLEHALLLTLKEQIAKDELKYGPGSSEIEIDEEWPTVNWGSVESLFSWGEYSKKPVLSEGLTITLEDSYGGEGKGEEYWIVLKVTTPTSKPQYFRVDGWYSSYSDYGPFEDSGEPYEVTAVERTVVAWEKTV